MATAVAFVETANRTADKCSRCGGFLIIEQCFDFLDSTGHLDFQAQRCVQCGDLVDPTILKNRQLHHAGASGMTKRS